MGFNSCGDEFAHKTINALIRPPRVVPSYEAALSQIEGFLESGERATRELGEIRAMINVNFGATGPLSHLINLGGDETESTVSLVFRALESLYRKLA